MPDYPKRVKLHRLRTTACPRKPYKPVYPYLRVAPNEGNRERISQPLERPFSIPVKTFLDPDLDIIKHSLRISLHQSLAIIVVLSLHGTLLEIFIGVCIEIFDDSGSVKASAARNSNDSTLCNEHLRIACRCRRL